MRKSIEIQSTDAGRDLMQRKSTVSGNCYMPLKTEIRRKTGLTGGGVKIQKRRSRRTEHII
jgi:hypothetical protein